MELALVLPAPVRPRLLVVIAAAALVRAGENALAGLLELLCLF